jgi:hypothetical protein
MTPSSTLPPLFALLLLWGALSVTAREPTGAEDRDWWAFEPVRNVSPPRIAADDWSICDLDRFIFAGLQKAALAPCAPADRRTLIRRATFDLTGLPPSMNEVEAFLSDPAPDAYARVIERLLSSPHYGEQWARHWLDVARYSDTKGYVYAREEKRWVHAPAYRDWVVRALNHDLPYDRFLKLQIAADQLVPAQSPDLAAMGFLTIGRRFLGVTHDIIDDRIDVVMRGTQALTVACARCHDHKFDPISTRDYYALYGVFQSCAEALVPCATGGSKALSDLVQKNRDLLTKRRTEQMVRTKARLLDYLEAQGSLEKYPPEGFDQIIADTDLNPFIVHRFAAWLKKHELTAEKLKGLGQPELEALFAEADSPALVPDEHIANIDMYFPSAVTTELWKSQGDLDRFILQTPNTPDFATVLMDRALPAAPRVFLRGNPLTKGDEVPRQYLPVLAQGEVKPFSKGSGRLELANAIADPRNPLTARVMVNRVWMHHFGRGLVPTTSDFGKRAELPSHPELLDWLAQRFIDSGWSLKELHRVVMLSQTYQQGSAAAPAMDPDNRWLTRMKAHRLSFEEARDAWLQASGSLNLSIGGRPVPLFGSENRRTLYALVDRENVPAVLRTFDFANPDLSIPQRSETTVPQQALFGMNHPFVVQQAKALLQSKGLAAADGDTARMRLIYAQLFQRQPTPEELATALEYVGSAPPPPAVLSGSPKAWQYGYGEWDESSGRMKAFTPLPHFTGSAWQGDDAWPNTKLGWAQLTATGGHPGNDRQHAVVRRWIAPADGSYTVTSKLIHEPKISDGIRAFVSHSRTGKLRSIELLGAEADVSFDALDLKAGDALDFIVDINGQLNSDQFLWAPHISMAGSTGSGGEISGSDWDAKKDFAALPRTPLTPWEQLVQVLMLSNEFLFID